MRRHPEATDRIGEELWLIRKNVPGVRGSITATSDGLLVAHDVHDLEPTQIAALVAAMHAVALRATLSTQCGQLREVITRGSDGYLAVYAASSAIIVAVLGTADLNVAILNFQARKMIERVAEHSADFTRRSAAPPASTPAPPSAPSAPTPPTPPSALAPPAQPAPPALDSDGWEPLPTRRPRGE